MDKKTFLRFLFIGITVGLIVGLGITFFPRGGSEKSTSNAAKNASAAASPAPVADDPNTQKVLALYPAADHVYVSIAGMGVLRSADGDHWETLRMGLADPMSVTAFVEVRPTRETVAAKFMEMGNIESPPDEEAMKKAFMALASQRPGLLAGTTDGRVLRLEDNAWKVVARLPVEDGGVYRLRYEPAVGLAACTGTGLFFSSDAGDAWTRVTDEPRTRDVLIGLDPAKRFLVAQYGGGLKICDLRGKCAPVKGAPDLLRRVAGDNSLERGWLGSDGDGLWRFEGSKPPAPEKTEALDNADIADLVAIGQRLIVAGGPEGLWIRDGAKSGWRPAIGLPPDSINSVAVFKGKIYAGTLKYGLYAATLDGERFKPVSF